MLAIWDEIGLRDGIDTLVGSLFFFQNTNSPTKLLVCGSMLRHVVACFKNLTNRLQKELLRHSTSSFDPWCLSTAMLFFPSFSYPHH